MLYLTYIFDTFAIYSLHIDTQSSLTLQIADK